MPLALPTPKSTREAQATGFIELLDKRLPLSAAVNPAHIHKHSYALFQETDMDVPVLGCAGRLIAQYLPIVGVTNQWAFLVPMLCPPRRPLSRNILFICFSYFGILSALHQKCYMDRPPTPDDFLQFAHSLVDPFVRETTVPDPPWTAGILEPVRRGYATLLEFYWSP
jgi:hypothetical protein